jgi:hypothetical protein
VAFNKRLDSIFPGMGQPLRNDAVFVQTGVIVTTAGSPQNTVHPSGGVLLSPTTSAGKLRIKIYNATVAASVANIRVTASDGTNTVLIGQSSSTPAVAQAVSATSWFEMMFEYILDVAGSGAGGGASGQLSSVVGGATSFTITTNLTGAGGSASMDIELAPLV